MFPNLHPNLHSWLCSHCRRDDDDVVVVVRKTLKEMSHVKTKLDELKKMDNMWGNVWANELRRIEQQDWDALAFQVFVLNFETESCRDFSILTTIVALKAQRACYLDCHLKDTKKKLCQLRARVGNQLRSREAL